MTLVFNGLANQVMVIGLIMVEKKVAQKHLAIQDVKLRSSRISVRDDVDLSELDLQSAREQSFRKSGSIEEVEYEHLENSEDVIWYYKFMYTAGMRLVPTSELEESVKEDYEAWVEIIVIFESRYVSPKKLSPEELEEFALDNVGFNVWPFFREYVQSTCSRIGMSPSFEVPFYRIEKSN